MDTKPLTVRVKRQHVDAFVWECQHKSWFAEIKFYEQGEPCVVISNPHWVNDGESLDDLLEGCYQSGKIYR